MDEERKENKKELTVRKILGDFKRAYEYKKNLLKEQKEDIEFALGKQWDAADVQSLADVKVRALTINKIRPNIFLLKGIESQNRSDFTAFPEGQEDSITAEISTKLMKNIQKNSEGEYKQSEQFEEGIEVGECYLEPYLDYTYDIINPKLKWKKVGGSLVFVAPNCKEYDLSDAPYVCKFTADLSEDELVQLFPDDEKLIQNMQGTKIDIGVWNVLKNLVAHKQLTDYPQDGSGSGRYDPDTGESAEQCYDLLEYFYKKMVKTAFIVDRKLKKLKAVESEEQAQKYVDIANQIEPGSADIAYRKVPEIWLASVIGSTKISDDRVWSYPRWRCYPFIPYFAYRSTADLDANDSALLVQGIVRSQKDLNRDYNKRATQELRHLNASANSGWQAEDDSLTPDQEEMYKQFGATPGVMLKHKKSTNAPVRIEPTALSAGHYQITLQRAAEMKESSGINTDLLAMNESQASGKAIAMRTKQGLVMVQGIFDNNSRTRKIQGRFILSQLGEVFDTDKALRVMGDKWLLQNFGEPQMEPQLDPMTQQPVMRPDGQPMMKPIMRGNTPELQVTENSQSMAKEAINKVLNDPLLGDYDVSVGDGVNAETTRYANYLMLQEMMSKGIPVPPDVMVDESSLNESSKEKIRQAIERSQSVAVPGMPAK